MLSDELKALPGEIPRTTPAYLREVHLESY